MPSFTVSSWKQEQNEQIDAPVVQLADNETSKNNNKLKYDKV